MKKVYLTSLFILALLCAGFSSNPNPTSLKSGFILGNPEIQSINALSFGPEQILFLGDAEGAQIVAVDISNEISQQTNEVNLTGVDHKIAATLGVTAEQVKITDMAVHPESNQIFFALTLGNGTPLLMKLDGENFKVVSMDNVSHQKTSLKDAISKDAVDRRDRSLRKWAISDMRFDNQQVFVTGLSNKEFGSTFRSIPFPFSEDQSYASLEIYHAAHGQYETNSPVKTFTSLNINNEPHIIASYTCTPLVIFPLSELKQGKHTKGRTVAELGNMNTPLDIIEIENEGERYVLLANSSRALMKIKVKDIESYNDALTEPVKERSATAGVDFIALPFVNVLQLDKYGDNSFVVLQRTAEGDLTLRNQSARWL